MSEENPIDVLKKKLKELKGRAKLWNVLASNPKVHFGELLMSMSELTDEIEEIMKSFKESVLKSYCTSLEYCCDEMVVALEQAIQDQEDSMTE